MEKMNGPAVGPVRTLVTSNEARGVSLAVLRRVIIVKNKIVKKIKRWVCVLSGLAQIRKRGTEIVLGR